MSTVAYDNGAQSGQETLQSLKNHPLIREYASVDDNLYDLIKATNPTLKMFIDAAKEIVEGGD
jgi:cell fate (sporulation/competence/biofilm development) regulator YmcA (YheA/YmcA/DUF963 family)